MDWEQRLTITPNLFSVGNTAYTIEEQSLASRWELRWWHPKKGANRTGYGGTWQSDRAANTCLSKLFGKLGSPSCWEPGLWGETSVQGAVFQVFFCFLYRSLFWTYLNYQSLILVPLTRSVAMYQRIFLRRDQLPLFMFYRPPNSNHSPVHIKVVCWLQKGTVLINKTLSITTLLLFLRRNTQKCHN